MKTTINNKIYDFDLRSREFAKDINKFVKHLPFNLTNNEYSKQLVRSAGSIGANYIEADESLGKKDCLKHMKIARKEANECIHWLELIDTADNPDLIKERDSLKNEARELFLILCSMVNKINV